MANNGGRFTGGETQQSIHGEGSGNSIDSVEADDVIPLDDILSVLSHERRRHVLEILRDFDNNVVVVDDVLDRLLDSDRTDTSGEGTSRDLIRTVLIHNHLLKLEDAGLASFDSESQRIMYHPHPKTETLLDTITNLES